MSDTSQGPGWWQASDGKWYPPEQAPGGAAAAAGGSGLPTVDIGGAFSYGWSKFTANAGPLIVAFLVMLVLLAIVDGIGFAIDSLVLKLLVNLIAIVVAAFASFGLANVALKIVNGEHAEIGDALPQGPRVIPYAITAILVQLIVTIGLYLCIFPGLIAATFLWFAHFAVIDEGLAPGDAISRSVQLVKDHFWAVVGFIVLAFLINIVGFVLCCVGTFITVPLTTVAAAFVYKGLKGQTVAA